MKPTRGTDRSTRRRTKAAAGRHTAPTVDAYLSVLDGPVRTALERLRAIIRAAEPELEECINYGVPSYRLGGKHTVSFGAAAKHCAFYPGAVVDDFAEQLQAFATSKGTIRFSPDEPLPARLVRALVRAQVARRRARPG